MSKFDWFLTIGVLVAIVAFFAGTIIQWSDCKDRGGVYLGRGNVCIKADAVLK